MKTTTGLIVLGGLISFSESTALPSQDVPVQCATICGPMVELSSKCSPAEPARNQPDDANDAGNVWIGRRHADAEAEADIDGQGTMHHDARPTGTGEDHLDRRFFTIVPAPTWFAEKYSSLLDPNNSDAPEQSSAQTQTMAVVESSVPPPLRHPPAAPAVPSWSSSTPLSIQTTSTSWLPNPTSDVPDVVTSTMMLAGSDAVSPAGEVQCVCLNKSFDVARVAGLCTSCITQAGDSKTNMLLVMNVCGFAGQKYTPGDDRTVDNVRVSATRPNATAISKDTGSSANGAPRRGGSVACLWGLMWLFLALVTRGG